MFDNDRKPDNDRKIASFILWRRRRLLNSAIAVA